MSELYGLDGKMLNKKEIEVDGFTFDSIAMSENPFLMMMALICIDPNEKQAELLNKAEVVFMDANNKQMFPPIKEDDVKN